MFCKPSGSQQAGLTAPCAHLPGLLSMQHPKTRVATEKQWGYQPGSMLSHHPARGAELVSPHQPSFPPLGSAPSHRHSKAGPRDDPELLRDKWRLSFHSGYFYISKNKAVLEEQPFQGLRCPQLGAGSTQLAAAPGWGCQPRAAPLLRGINPQGSCPPSPPASPGSRGCTGAWDLRLMHAEDLQGRGSFRGPGAKHR